MLQKRVFPIVVILLMVHITCFVTVGYSQNLKLPVRKPISKSVEVNQEANNTNSGINGTLTASPIVRQSESPTISVKKPISESVQVNQKATDIRSSTNRTVTASPIVRQSESPTVGVRKPISESVEVYQKATDNKSSTNRTVTTSPDVLKSMSPGFGIRKPVLKNLRLYQREDNFKSRINRTARLKPYPETAQIVPLEIARYEHPSTSKTRYRIDPGNIPPNFVHTWVLDVKDIESFRLHFESLDDVKLDKDDRITIHNVDSLKSNMPLASFGITGSVTEMTVDITNAGYDREINGKSYKRVFVQLETSEDDTPRRFVVSGLITTEQKEGTEEVLVFGDDLDYQGSNIAENVPSPFHAGVHTNNNAYPPAHRKDGWYLIGKDVADPSKPFNTLAYYNEQRGRLRLYLRNQNMPINVSGATVTVSLWRYAEKNNDYGEVWTDAEQLKGAFFPLHPNPNKWSSATVPLVNWGHHNWACIELDMLYPMAENIPVDPGGAFFQPDNWYYSLYEEPLMKGFRNIQLRVKVDTYDYGTLSGTWVGKAVGEALQELDGATGDTSLIDMVKEAAKTGGDVYEGAKKVHDGVKDYYHKVKDSKEDIDGLKLLGNVASMGASVFSGGFAAAGAVYSFIDSLFGGSPVEPLQLSIELDLQGTLNASLKIEHTQGPLTEFYLPGRYSIEEAYDLGLDIYSTQALAAVSPRYDRTVGLFGYRHNPGELELPLVASGVASKYAEEYYSIHLSYPAVSKPQAPTNDLLEYARTLNRWLPVIYNPYAEITPMTPILVGEQSVEKEIPEDDKMCGSPPWSNPWWNRDDVDYEWYFDISWKSHVNPEPDDTSFPNNVTLHGGPGPKLYAKVYHDREAYATCYPYHDWLSIDPNNTMLQVIPEKRLTPSTYQALDHTDHVKVHNAYTMELKTRDENGQPQLVFSSDDSYPLDSVIYHWDLPYFYYGRTRQKENGDVPRYRGMANLKSPVTLDVTMYKQWAEGYEWNYEKKETKVKGVLLQPEGK